MNYSIKNAKLVSQILNGLGGLLLGILFFFPQLSSISLFFLLLLLPACILAIHLFKGLLKFDDPQNIQYPSLAFVMITVPIGILLKTILTYLIVDFLNVILIAIPITILLTYLALKGTKEFTSKKFKDYLNYFFVGVFLFGYSFGTVVIINCELDFSSQEEFKYVKVVKKENSGSFLESYQIKIETNDKDSISTTLPISIGLYEEVDLNDSIVIDFQSGFFDIPWIRLRMINND